ncbi:MAG: S41 family peptidase [Candidatus Tantalella remota]|nr:S41 family peptidase [Candidatus Tantalella remota]
MRSRFLIGIFLATALVAVVMTVSAEDNTIIDDSKGLFSQVQLFADALTLISTDYVEPVKVKDLIHGAISGMMKTLDDYSQFLDPEEFKEMTEETKGEFGGIGIEIGIRDGILTVIAPIDDTPASKAGMEAGDRIVKINDKVTRDMTLDDAVKELRGEAGTKIELTVVREDEDKILTFKIKRAIIKLKSIKEARIIEGDVGYIKLVEFQERTAKDLRRAIKELRGSDAASLIIDLRNNPGGLLDASVEVADQFLEQGELIVYTEGRDPKKRMEFRAKKKPEFEDMDLVLIVNKGSASASEILAGALKDNKRALVVGETTFGKGSVQTVIPLKDRSALRLTTAAYFTPSGANLMDKGVEPDIVIKKQKIKTDDPAKKKDAEKDRVFARIEDKGEEKTDEDKKEPGKYDNQLEAAVNILKGAKVFEEYRAAAMIQGEHTTGAVDVLVDETEEQSQ